MMQKTFMGLICLGLLLVSLPLQPARSADGSILLAMLGMVPDTADIRQGEVVFADTDALFAAFPDVPQIRNVTDWENMRTGTSGNMKTWMAIMTGLIDYSQFNRIYSMASETVKTTGLDLFSVRRSIGFGRPPVNGLVLGGTFDRAAISSAFSALEYTVTDQGDGSTLICSSDGCGEGTRTNLRSRRPENPFGGQLGRKEPLLVTDSLIFNSPNYEVLGAIISASKGDAPSLAEAPDYLAAAEALTERGMLIQAAFLPIAAFNSEPLATPEPPPYILAAFGQALVDDQFVTLIGLVYPQESDAQTAIQMIPERIKLAESLRLRRPWLTLIEQRKGGLGEGSVFKSSSGMYVAVLPIISPVPKTDAGDYASLYVYRLLFESFASRDLPWLAIKGSN